MCVYVGMCTAQGLSVNENREHEIYSLFHTSSSYQLITYPMEYPAQDLDICMCRSMCYTVLVLKISHSLVVNSWTFSLLL